MLNRCVLIGRLTKDPELRYTQDGKAVCSFTLAVDRNYGEKKLTDFFDIIAWNKMGESCANYLGKGKLAAVDGQMTTRSYEAKDGHKVKVYELVAQNVRFLSPKTEQKDEVFNEAPADVFNAGGEDEERPF